MKKRLLCLLLALALLLPLVMQMSPEARAAIKQEKKRAIGIVFDNSGSMYGSTNSSWCRATYAMEVFASMMNDGDQLQIYPMWPISLGAGSPQESSPLVINGPEEASIIRQIYTPFASTTPFSTVEEAYEGLMATQADEKYLIVLTDGVFDECQHNTSMDPKHHDIVNSYSVNNVVISNRYISKMIAQIGEVDALFDFYADILSYDEEDEASKEIYIKKVSEYFEEIPGPCTAAQLIRGVLAASTSKELSPEERDPNMVLGYVKPNGEKVIFGGNQAAIRVALEPEDKLIIFSSH